MGSPRMGELYRAVAPFEPCILTLSEIAALSRLHALHPKGLPEDVQLLFVREAVVGRIVYTHRAKAHD